MTKITTTTIERSSDWQLKALLALARDGAQKGSFLPGELVRSADLARHLSVLCGDSIQSSEALVSALSNRQTPLPVLQGIKDLAKTLDAKATTEIEHAASTLLYHAAIAAALGRHRQNISSRPGVARYALYEDLGLLLVGSQLGDVFLDAAEALATDPKLGGRE
jgi:hypothetical protein